MLTAVESLAAQPEIKEIIVIDDHSSDGTAAALRQLSSRYAQLRVLETTELPGGWVRRRTTRYRSERRRRRGTGCCSPTRMACTWPAPARMADASESGAGLVSYSPEQVTHTWWEKALIPFVYTRHSANHSYAEVNHPESPAARSQRTISAHPPRGLFADRRTRGRRGQSAGTWLWRGALACAACACTLLREWPSCAFECTGRFEPCGRAGRKFVSPYRRRNGWNVPRRGTRTFQGGALDSIVGPSSGIAAFQCRVCWAWRSWRAGMLRMPRTCGEIVFPAALALYYFPGVALYAAALLNSEWRYTRGSVVWKGRE